AIIPLSFCVSLVTLLGQGFTRAPLMRRLGVRETGEEEEREEIAARLRASEAALARLEELASEPWMHQGALSHTRDRYRLRTRHLRGHADGVLETPIEAKSSAHLRLARQLLAAERPRRSRGPRPSRRARSTWRRSVAARRAAARTHGMSRRLRRSRWAPRQRASSSAASRWRRSGAARRIARSSAARSNGTGSAPAACSSNRVARAGSARAPASVTTTPST